MQNAICILKKAIAPWGEQPWRIYVRAAAIRPPPRHFDLNQVIVESAEHFRSFVGDHATLTIDLAPALPLFLGDKDAVARSLTALLCYSLRCLSEATGTILLRTGIRYVPNVQNPSTYTFIEIYDTGTAVNAVSRRRAIEDTESVLVAVSEAISIHDGAILIERKSEGYLTSLLFSAKRTITGKRRKMSL